MKLKAGLIQELREKTNAPILDCKKALLESNGNIDQASQLLREKGITQADKRAHKKTAEGIIVSYIHPGSKLGVLLQLNCETDFVARTNEFVGLAKEISLQVAASAPRWISREDIPQEVIAREREIFSKQAQNEKKPEKVMDKIVQGRLEKFFSESCLLEQPYVKDDKQSVEELVKSTIGTLKENIRIARFERYKIGEEISGEES